MPRGRSRPPFHPLFPQPQHPQPVTQPPGVPWLLPLHTAQPRVQPLVSQWSHWCPHHGGLRALFHRQPGVCLFFPKNLIKLSPSKALGPLTVDSASPPHRVEPTCILPGHTRLGHPPRLCCASSSMPELSYASLRTQLKCPPLLESLLCSPNPQAEGALLSSSPGHTGVLRRDARGDSPPVCHTLPPREGWREG